MPNKDRNELHCNDLQWSTISCSDRQWATISYNYDFLPRAAKITGNDRLSFIIIIIIIIINLTLMMRVMQGQIVSLNATQTSRLDMTLGS